MSGRVRLWCLRHAESENVTAEVAGAVPTAPLTERGRRQAIKAAQTLAGEPISRLAARDASSSGWPGVEVQGVPELVEVGIGRHEGSSDPAIRRQTADVLRAWVVEHDLGQRVADGETGHDVIARMTEAFQLIADHHQSETVAVVGHVASLTVALGQLCALGALVWGTPLPHAEPFLVEWDGRSWHCSAWPGATS